MPLLANGLAQMVRTQGTPLVFTAAIRQTARANEQPASDVQRGHDGRDHSGFAGLSAILDDPAGDFCGAGAGAFHPSESTA